MIQFARGKLLQIIHCAEGFDHFQLFHANLTNATQQKINKRAFLRQI